MSNNNFELQTPVLFLVFNRLDTTKQVFEAIRQAQPPRFYIAGDGARENREGDAEKVQAVRDYIISNIDWDCQIFTNFSDINLGCGKGPAAGIRWFFENEEQGIILEDDCLPHTTFFRFCDVMLDKYREDKRIMMIAGTNFLGEWKSEIQTYHFSYYGGSWGWASWKRAWEYFDYEIKLWGETEIRERVRDILASEEQFKARQRIYSLTYQNPHNISWWDYQWGFARLIQSGLSIVPSVNLISNIGFGENATHTKSKLLHLSIEQKEITFPLKINAFIAVDREYDNMFFKKFMKKKNIFQRIKSKLFPNK